MSLLATSCGLCSLLFRTILTIHKLVDKRITTDFSLSEKFGRAMSTEASQRHGDGVRRRNRLGAVLSLIKGGDDVQQVASSSRSNSVIHELVESGKPSIPQTRIQFSRRTTRLLWLVAVLDMVAVAWMIAAGSWFDQTSRLTSVVTLGGHHTLVLIMALVSFVMLAGLGLPTKGFTSAINRDAALLTIACFMSIVALAGAISLILPVAVIVFLLGFIGLFRR